jgi:hypothetical protein
MDLWHREKTRGQLLINAPTGKVPSDLNLSLAKVHRPYSLQPACFLLT